MTAVLAPMAVPAVKSWAEVLAEAIRPEFAVTVYWPAEDDRVLWPRWCRVANCRSQACGSGLCGMHRSRWQAEGSPDLDLFAYEPSATVSSASSTASSTTTRSTGRTPPVPAKRTKNQPSRLTSTTVGCLDLGQTGATPGLP